MAYQSEGDRMSVIGRLMSLNVCRPRAWKMLVLVVALLMMAQFSFNLLFYRNYDSLFYVNVTASGDATGGAPDLPMISQLRVKVRVASLVSEFSWLVLQY